MQMQSFGDYGKCVHLSHEGAEMVLSSEFGPRILSFGPIGGGNIFFLFPDGKGSLGIDGYCLYGGHRLWIAPEVPSRTMQVDNDPVHIEEIENGCRLQTQRDVNHIAKALEIRLLPNGVWEVSHEVRNHGAYEVDLAIWALSMLKEGSEVAFPNAPFIPHHERVLPARPLVLWHYTDLGDPRWTHGKRLTRLKQRVDGGPVKVGTFIEQGYAVAQCQEGLLLKRFEIVPDVPHVDMGCNFEAFTNQEMIEIETLSPMLRLAEGESATHKERWKFLPGVVLPIEDDKAANFLERECDSRLGLPTLTGRNFPIANR